MKKTILTALGVILLSSLLLVSCGKADGKKEENETGKEPEKQSGLEVKESGEGEEIDWEDIAGKEEEKQPDAEPGEEPEEPGEEPEEPGEEPEEPEETGIKTGTDTETGFGELIPIH